MKKLSLIVFLFIYSIGVSQQNIVVKLPRIKGDLGFTGKTGTTGSLGITGATGTTGYTGITGGSGKTGSTGDTGNSGNTGVTGTTGAGFTGATGYTGISGKTGFTGITGYTGDLGITGTTGVTGSSGSTSATGFTGRTGTTGTIGNTGVTGNTGSVGITGTTGTIGATGSISAVSAIGTSPNTNGATLTGTVLNLEPTNASFGGVITTSAQTVGAGVKTFTSDAIINGLTIGKGAGNVSTNTSLGLNALSSNTIGSNNVAVANSLAANLSGTKNIAMGNFALNAGTAPTNNIAIGDHALGSDMSNNGQVAIGDASLSSNTTGTVNTACGWQVLKNNNGDANTGFGWHALLGNTTATYNGAFGVNALANNTTGSYNLAFGGSALQQNTTADENTAMGYATLSNQTGSACTQNVAVGSQAGLNVSNGHNNTFVGFQAGNTVTGGDYNVMIGSNTGGAVDIGDNNTFIGSRIGSLSNSLSNNVILADGAGNIRAQWDNLGAGTIPVSLTTPLLIGGTTTTSPLTFRTTTANAVSGADHIFQVGNNGSIEAFRIRGSDGRVAAMGNSFGTSAFTVNNSNAALGGITVSDITTSATVATDGIYINKDITPTGNISNYNALTIGFNNRGGTSQSTVDGGGIGENIAMFNRATVGTTLADFTGERFDLRNLGAGTITNLNGSLVIAAENLAGGGVVTNFYGYRVKNQTDATIGTTLCASFAGGIASGTGRYNIYMSGTANNYFGGNVGIIQSLPTSSLDVTGGSVSNSYNLVTSATTLNATYYNVNLTNAGASYAITLPSASGITGRTYRIKQMTGTACTVTTGGEQILSLINTNVSPLLLTVGTVGYWEFQSNGTDWILNQ